MPCRHAPRLSGHRIQRDGADAGGEQPRAEGVVSCAGGIQGRQGADMADARHLRRTELRGEQRGVERDRLGAVGRSAWSIHCRAGVQGRPVLESADVVGPRPAGRAC